MGTVHNQNRLAGEQHEDTMRYVEKQRETNARRVNRILVAVPIVVAALVALWCGRQVLDAIMAFLGLVLVAGAGVLGVVVFLNAPIPEPWIIKG